MINYIDIVQHLISAGDDYMQDDNADIYYDYDQEDEYEEETQGDRVASLFSGLGHKQSTFIHDEGRFSDGFLDMTDDNVPILLKRAMNALSVDDSISLKLCIEEGLDVTDKDEAGQTLLHFGADRGSIASILTLLECGADPNAADNDGISVLEAAGKWFCTLFLSIEINMIKSLNILSFLFVTQ